MERTAGRAAKERMGISRAGICKGNEQVTSNKLKSKSKELALVTRYSLLVSLRGFTLIELIVVIFIVSLVLAVSFPSFYGIGENRTKSEAKRLASLVRHLNDSALSRKETLNMKITFDDKVILYAGPDGEKSEKLDSLSGIELQSRGMVSEGEITLFFSPLGATESFAAHFRDDGSDMSVQFNGTSGRVKITTSNK
jgi:prepilin-type N-terminal cleavage/methylation domain-containing protein